jgi:hypothetical protein
MTWLVLHAPLSHCSSMSLEERAPICADMGGLTEESEMCFLTL